MTAQLPRKQQHEAEDNRYDHSRGDPCFSHKSKRGGRASLALFHTADKFGCMNILQLLDGLVAIDLQRRDRAWPTRNQPRPFSRIVGALWQLLAYLLRVADHLIEGVLTPSATTVS